jgi:hypothetical protein
MLRIFKGTGPEVIVLIAITFIVLWISTFIEPRELLPPVYDSDPMPLYAGLKFILGNSSFVGLIFIVVLLTLVLFMLVNFNTTVFFINERTFMPAIIYLLFSSFFPQCQVINPVLPAVVFLMLAIRRIMDSYRKPGIAYNFFDAGLLISIGSLFYANMIWFGLLTIIGIALIRTGNIKEIGVAFLGLITPYILTAGIFYVAGKDMAVYLATIRNNIFGESVTYTFTWYTIAAVIFIALILIVSIIFLLMGMNSKKIKARKTFSLLLWGFLLALLAYFVLPSVSAEIVWIAGIPATYFLSYYFVFARKKIIPEVIFSGFFLVVLLIQVFKIF